MTGPTRSRGHAREIDPTFTALPLQELADAALQRARDLGADHVEVRVHRLRSGFLVVRDEALQTATDSTDLGLAVRVVHRGAWGFASGVVLTPAEAVRLAETAVAVAEVSSGMTTRPVVLAPEPVHDEHVGVVLRGGPLRGADRRARRRARDWSARLRRGAAVDHASSWLMQFHECTFYADSAGTRTTQQRVRMFPGFEASGTDQSTGTYDAMSSIAPPVGRGWEYVAGVDGAPREAGGPMGLGRRARRAPGPAGREAAAPGVEAGTYDLVVHPSNLWLTIHESIGHATELDRALGYEANYAGTSFATYDQLGSLRYGSEVMNVTGDRTVEHGLATTGWDHEGVEAQEWDLVKDGVLVGYQLDRPTAGMHPELNGGRSNGCAHADSPGHIPIQRMANVSLAAAPDGPSTEELIGRVDRGIYVVGDRSWSIDMQRYNFQFTGQRFYEIRGGELRGQLRDVAYQATTTEFWGSLEAVGGPQTWVLGGAFNCGKAQPGQVAAVSHGCPTSLFRGVRILNTDDEAAH